MQHGMSGELLFNQITPNNFLQRYVRVQMVFVFLKLYDHAVIDHLLNSLAPGRFVKKIGM